MRGPLLILALLSIGGGWIGIERASGWFNMERFTGFLAPVIGAKSAEGGSAQLELTLSAVAVGVALVGWLLAYLFYRERSIVPARLTGALPHGYKLLSNKYYVDEIYAAVFVKPLIDGSTRILWQDVDRKIIDAAVNDAGDGARHVSDEARHMQSGNIRSYAGWIAAGSAVVIAFMIWMGVR